jgi:hypothetical protein
MKKESKPWMKAYAYNPNYKDSGDPEDCHWRPASLNKQARHGGI